MNTPATRTALLAGLFCCALLAAGCGKPAESAPPAVMAGADPNFVTVSADAARYGGFVESEVVERALAAPLQATGRVVINEERTAQVGALFEGRVVAALAQVGDRVRAGQPLARMHTHEVHEARASHAAARAELNRRKTEADLARSVLERARRLYRARAIAFREVEQAEAAVAAAEQEVRRAEAELQRAIGHLGTLGLEAEGGDYDQPVTINAPISGVVLKRDVSPGAAVVPGTPVYTISDLASLWVIAEVPERHLASLKPGAPVSVEVAAYPGASFSGKVARLGEQLDPQTRAVQVRCVVENRDGRLKPEMYATVRVEIGQTRMARMVAAEAVQEIDGQTAVFVARGGHAYEKRAIVVGRREGEWVEVLEGLEAGQRVVARGSFLLKSEFLKARFAEEE